MKKYSILILSMLYLLLIQNESKGQECGTDYHHNQLMQTDSSYQKQFLINESLVRSIVQNQTSNKLRSGIYTIPVVVHVIHLGEPLGTGSNISDYQIQQAIVGLNQRFRPLTANSVDIEMEFCLANKDPNGNSTTGINRVNGINIPNYQANGIQFLYSNCNAASEASVKDLSKWPVSDYYNIWVVNKICQGFGGFSGFAYLPNGGPYDRTVITYYAMSDVDITLAHEVGHGFSLYHTFNNDGGNVYCPIDTSCLINGDYVCDTPPHKQGDCGSTNPCTVAGNWSNSMNNYMSYCGSRDRFTLGQKERMRAAAIIAPRVSLLTSIGCGPVGIEEISIDPVFSIFPNPATNSFTIKFNNIIAKGNVQIFNLLGKKVFGEDLIHSNQDIRVQTLSMGIYFVSVYDGGRNYIKKLIIQNN